MNRFFLLITLLFAIGCTQAQTTYTPPATIPPYRILTTDSVYVTPANLKKNKPVMVIYFSPDCGHCQHLMHEMKPKMKAFQNIQIVMITFVQQIKAIQVFYRDFDLKKYPNITVGTEGYTYLVQKYYKVKTTPYIAFYDKNGKLVQFFDHSPLIDDVVKAAGKV